jgi:hypothetical protein
MSAVTIGEFWRRGQVGWPRRFPIAQFPNPPLLLAFSGWGLSSGSSPPSPASCEALHHDLATSRSCATGARRQKIKRELIDGSLIAYFENEGYDSNAAHRELVQAAQARLAEAQQLRRQAEREVTKATAWLDNITASALWGVHEAPREVADGHVHPPTAFVPARGDRGSNAGSDDDEVE